MIKVDPLLLYVNRVLVFMETEPQSNVYNQVILNAEQFKAMSEHISEKTGNKLSKDVDEVNIELSEEEYKLPDLREIHD